MLTSAKETTITPLPMLDPQRLPQCTRLLVELIGLKTTLKLLARHGGKSFYIPKHLHDDSPLLDCIGFNQAQKLSQYYGGETLDLPKVDTIKRQFRDMAIAKASACGVSRSELVARYGLSRRQIGNIRRKYRDIIERLQQQQTPRPVASTQLAGTA